MLLLFVFFFFSSRRRHTRCLSDWSSDVCSSDLPNVVGNGSAVATSVAVASPLPNAATMDSIASGLPTKLAAETQTTGAACTTVTLRPAMVSVPRRELEFGFLETSKLTAPAPLPLGPDVIVIIGSLDSAVHAQPSATLTLTTPAPPWGGKA